MSDRATPLVLNVDDYAAGRYARTRTLETAGFAVTEAATGGQALDLAFGLAPAVVLLDVNLPDISGFEVCRRLRAAPATRDAAVLHVSATHVQPSDHVAGMEGGADGYLTEPVEPAVLVATVNMLLRVRRMHATAVERAVRAEAALAALVSDLREPASTVVGWTRTLRGGFHDAANREQAFDAIERNARALAERLDAAVGHGARPVSPLAGVDVLVVEDEPDTRELVALILQHAGARVTPASTALEALNAVARAPIDVVIADLSLPDADGCALIPRIREVAGDAVRAIALTGWVRAQDERRARAAGFDAYLRKPAEPADLVDLVRAMVPRA